MYYVSAQGVDERMINGHYYYYYVKSKWFWLCVQLDGQCACLDGRGGRTCGDCEDFFFGDPNDQCFRESFTVSDGACPQKLRELKSK